MTLTLGFPVFVFVLTFIGLTTVFAAVGLWRRESEYSLFWLVSRPGLGVLCLLSGGAILVAGAHYRLSRWTPLYAADLLSALSPRTVTLLVTCFLLLAIGVALRVLGGRAAKSRVVHGTSLFVWSAAVALIITLVELNAFQLLNDRVVRAISPVELDTQGIRPDLALTKDYQFTAAKDWVSVARPSWEKALERYKGQPNVRYLEVGLFEGRSAVWMLENILTHPTARLTGIDPFSDPVYDPPKGAQAYRDVFYSNLKRSGFESKADIIEGYSQIELRRLPLESFDFIYIDGSHEARDVLEDGILCVRLLKDGGLLIFDDYRMNLKTKYAMDTFFTFFGDDFEPIHVGAQAILKKKN